VREVTGVVDVGLPRGAGRRDGPREGELLAFRGRNLRVMVEVQPG
jgi:hypothetical protein